MLLVLEILGANENGQFGRQTCDGARCLRGFHGNFSVNIHQRTEREKKRRRGRNRRRERDRKEEEREKAKERNNGESIERSSLSGYCGKIIGSKIIISRLLHTIDYNS